MKENRYKVYYKSTFTNDVHADAIDADGFKVEMGVLIFFNRERDKHSHAYKEWLKVHEE